LALVKEDDIKPEQIEEVIIGIETVVRHLCEPVSVRHYPRNAIDLQFSIPYNVANAIINKKVSLKDYTDKATRVRSWVDPEVDVDRSDKACTASRIQIRTKDGNLHVKRVDKPKGEYTNPLTMQEITEKFWDCAGFLERPIAKERLKKVLELVTHLEDVVDVREIIRLLI
jgi:2-methylcitrate dehydratase PrpD